MNHLRFGYSTGVFTIDKLSLEERVRLLCEFQRDVIEVGLGRVDHSRRRRQGHEKSARERTGLCIEAVEQITKIDKHIHLIYSRYRIDIE